jgi:predicted nucleotidyltransferase
MTEDSQRSVSSTVGMDIDLDADVDELVEQYQRLAAELQHSEQTPVDVEDLDAIRNEVEDRVGTSMAVKLLL